ncbi:Mobile element protein [hydrothermal vent metagenome]|uniref:Mobile element protein n=1 Tax=hydrothermal vent metagenome TaxID=652676 RepID=A0A3B1DY40_9ZZZZ
MSKVQEVLRLKYLNQLSNRQIETIVGVSRNSVANYVKLFETLNCPIDEVLLLNNDDLEDLFHPNKKQKKIIKKVFEPDWNQIQQELTKKGMTRKLLYEELKETNSNIYSYSQFNRNYKKYVKLVNPSMRQIHYGGDKLFIDYSGLTMPITDSITNTVTKAQIFVSVMGASGYTFVHATPSQSTKDFILSHVMAFQFYGGVPNILLPDNLKAAVISNKKGVVRLNDSYADMGRHYSVAIEPARPYKPQDKSKVELGVKAIQRWILMKLRNHTFFSVDELNEQINLLLDGYNNKIIRRLGKSRTELFQTLDKPHLHPLVANRYVYKEFKKATVGVDYHIELEGSGYSVPYKYLGQKVDVTYSSNDVVISLNGEIIATHKKLAQKYNDSTNKEHMPPSHQYQYEKWNPRRILNWASTIGAYTIALMEKIMSSKTHEVRGYRSCMAILNFSKQYDKTEFEIVSKVAVELNIYSVGSIESMLKTKSYIQHIVSNEPTNHTYTNGHENIRGSEYYSQLAK